MDLFGLHVEVRSADQCRLVRNYVIQTNDMDIFIGTRWDHKLHEHLNFPIHIKPVVVFPVASSI